MIKHIGYGPTTARNDEGLSEKIGMATKIAISIAKMNAMMLLTMRFWYSIFGHIFHDFPSGNCIFVWFCVRLYGCNNVKKIGGQPAE